MKVCSTEITATNYVKMGKWSFKVAVDVEGKEHWYVDMDDYKLYVKLSQYQTDPLDYMRVEDALDLFKDLGMTLTASDLRANIKEAETELYNV